MKTHHHWSDFAKKKTTPPRLAAIDREVEQELIAVDLRAARELLGKHRSTEPMPPTGRSLRYHGSNIARRFDAQR